MSSITDIYDGTLESFLAVMTHNEMVDLIHDLGIRSFKANRGDGHYLPTFFCDATGRAIMSSYDMHPNDMMFTDESQVAGFLERLEDISSGRDPKYLSIQDIYGTYNDFVCMSDRFAFKVDEYRSLSGIQTNAVDSIIGYEFTGTLTSPDTCSGIFEDGSPIHVIYPIDRYHIHFAMPKEITQTVMMNRRQNK